MGHGYFLTRLLACTVRGRVLDARFEAIRVAKPDAGVLITRNHLTPFSIDAAGSEAFEFNDVPIERVVVCRGSLELPQVFHLQVPGAVWWVSRGWLSGADQIATFARLWEQLSCDPTNIGIEVHPLCRTESVTLDDIVRMSRLD